MNDADGKPVRVGDLVCIVRSGRGRAKLATVRIVATYPGQPKTPAIRADDSKSGDIRNDDFTISAWLKSGDFAVIPMGNTNAP